MTSTTESDQPARRAKGRMYAAVRHPCLTFRGFPKRVYASEEEAQVAADRVNEYRSEDGHVAPYRCRACTMWHNGHPPRSPADHRIERAAIDRYLRSSVERVELDERVMNAIIQENMKSSKKRIGHIVRLAQIAQPIVTPRGERLTRVRLPRDPGTRNGRR